MSCLYHIVLNDRIEDNIITHSNTTHINTMVTNMRRNEDEHMNGEKAHLKKQFI